MPLRRSTSTPPPSPGIARFQVDAADICVNARISDLVNKSSADNDFSSGADIDFP
jgi:hypothetical protein